VLKAESLEVKADTKMSMPRPKFWHRVFKITSLTFLYRNSFDTDVH